jgi:hypothetical protein
VQKPGHTGLLIYSECTIARAANQQQERKRGDKHKQTQTKTHISFFFALNISALNISAQNSSALNISAARFDTWHHHLIKPCIERLIRGNNPRGGDTKGLKSHVDVMIRTFFGGVLVKDKMFPEATSVKPPYE